MKWSTFRWNRNSQRESIRLDSLTIRFRHFIDKGFHFWVIKDAGIPVAFTGVFTQSKFKQCRSGSRLLNKGIHLTFAAGFQARRIPISSRVFHTGTFSSWPLNECHWLAYTHYSWSHPCMANIDVSMRFERWRSLSSGVKDDSKIPRKVGSMKRPLLRVEVINTTIFVISTEGVPSKC